jgi:hypothetical protein
MPAHQPRCAPRSSLQFSHCDEEPREDDDGRPDLTLSCVRRPPPHPARYPSARPPRDFGTVRRCVDSRRGGMGTRRPWHAPGSAATFSYRSPVSAGFCILLNGASIPHSFDATARRNRPTTPTSKMVARASFRGSAKGPQPTVPSADTFFVGCYRRGTAKQKTDLYHLTAHPRTGLPP